MKFLDLSEGRFYLVRCSDWANVIQAEDETQACVESLVEMLERKGRDLKLSSVMITQRLGHDIMDEDYDEEVCYHSVSTMLANAGQHELASNLKSIFGA